MTSPAPVRTGYDDPHRVAPQVPLIVLPSVDVPITPWEVTRPSRLRAQVTLPVLDRLVDAARHPDRRRLSPALSTAVVELGDLAATLAAYEPMTRADTVEPGKLIHQYFGLRHSNSMSSGSAAFYAVCVIRWCIAEMEYAALDANDVLAELLACRQVICDIARAPRWLDSYETRPLDGETRAMLDYLPTGSPWDRWIVAHHGYLMYNLLAADEIRRAAARVWRRRDNAAVIDHLRHAAIQVRGLTATMIHSAVLPGRLYADQIRPSMAPPHLPTPLTGGMFSEHKAYHRALTALLDEMSEPHASLVRHQPGLARARHDLLVSDRMDLYRHVTMGEELLRPETSEKSLVQAPGDSAVGELIEMLHRREHRYRPFLAAAPQEE